MSRPTEQELKVIVCRTDECVAADVPYIATGREVTIIQQLAQAELDRRAQPSDKLPQDVESFLDRHTEVFTHKDGATAAVDVRVLRPFLASLQPKQEPGKNEDIVQRLTRLRDSSYAERAVVTPIDDKRHWLENIGDTADLAIAALQGEKG